MPTGPNTTVITHAPLTRGMVEDRSIQRPGDADVLVNFTLSPDGEGIVNRPGIDAAIEYVLDQATPPVVTTNTAALLDWGTGAVLDDATLHVLHGRMGIYLVAHGVLQRPDNQNDLIIYDARKMENTKLTTFSWLGADGRNASSYPDRARSVEFGGALILTFRGARSIIVEDGVDSLVSQANPYGLRVRFLTAVDRTVTPSASPLNDDPGPYLVDAASPASHLRCGIVAAHQHRVFWTGHPDDPNRAWYSNIDDPDAVSAFNTFDLSDSTEANTGIASVGSFLYIFTRRETWLLTDISIVGQEQALLVARGVGCIATGSIRANARHVMFLGEGGHVYEVSGQTVNDISDRRVKTALNRDQNHRNRVGSYLLQGERKYMLLFDRQMASDQSGLLDPNRTFPNRWYEFRLDRDAWFPREISVAENETTVAEPILDAVVIRDTDGKEKVHAARTQVNLRYLNRLWIDRGFSDEGYRMFPEVSLAPVNFYDDATMRTRCAWLITSESANKNVTVDPLADDDRVGQNASASLLDRSWSWGDGSLWGASGLSYRGEKPNKVRVGMRDGATYPVAGKHVGLFVEFACADTNAIANSVGGATLHGVQLEVVPKARRAA